jgi:hypothetical protein
LAIGPMGIGDWGLGIGPNPQSPIPNPQSPIPNYLIEKIMFIFIFIKKLKLIYLLYNRRIYTKPKNKF